MDWNILIRHGCIRHWGSRDGDDGPGLCDVLFHTSGFGNIVIRNSNWGAGGDEKSVGACLVRWSGLLSSTLSCASCRAAEGPGAIIILLKGVKTLTQDDIAEVRSQPSTTKTPVLGWRYGVDLPSADGRSEVHPWDPSSFTAGRKTKVLPRPLPSAKSWGAQEPYREPLYCYRYTLSFDDDKRLKDWKREECVPLAPVRMNMHSQ